MRKRISLLAIVALGVSACTEKRPMQEAPKVDLELVEKSTLCTEREYLYLPSTVEVSRTATLARPHWMGEAKIVKLKCERESLDVVEVDPDDRRRNNPTNGLPVLSIPMEHVDFRCAPDADNRCSQREERDEHIPWQQRRYVSLKFSDLKVQELNFIPEQLVNAFGGFGKCLDQTGEKVVFSSVKPDAINMILERSYQTSIACASGISELREVSFSSRSHYSIVARDSVLTPEYKPFVYNRADQNRFGFFTTKTSRLDVDNVQKQSGEVEKMNRWSPTRTVVYELSPSFFKPENRVVLGPTLKAVESINRSLAVAGSALRLKVSEAAKGSSPSEFMSGDLRKTTMVLEDDPLALGLIGYGPSVADPRTGEIVSAKTVMYLGTLKKFVSRTYDEIVEQIKQESVPAPAVPISGEALKKMGPKASLTTKTTNQTTRGRADTSTGRGLPPLAGLKDFATNPLRHPVSREDFRKNPAQLLEHKNCFFKEDMLGTDEELIAKAKELVKKFGGEDWNSLTESQRSEAMTLLLPIAWTPVLVHEIGHNLGLRHNFAGSEDKANFYEPHELKTLGYDRSFNYSSVMDYAYRTFNELPIMGKYDIAALRYGYAEKLETAAGTLISVEEFKAAPKTELKDFQFCTDEHVALNPNCNVFDEGATLVEMVSQHIDAYKENYQKNNFRNQRANFSLMDDRGYMARIERTMGSLRRVFERYESIKHTFGLTEDSPYWESIDFLKDLRQATRLAAAFYVKVLQTPDLTCAIAEASSPNSIRFLVPILSVSPFAISCFDKERLQLNQNFVVVGEAGKLFQSRKDPASDNPYLDQIDVRGIWLDKVLAARALLQRKTGVLSFDKVQDNFLDIPDLRPAVEAALTGLMTNAVVAPIEIRIPGQGSLDVETLVSMHDDSDKSNGHRIEEGLDPELKEFLDLPHGSVGFQAALVGLAKTHLPSLRHRSDPTSLLNAMATVIAVPGVTVPSPDHVTTAVGIQKIMALKNSALSGQAIEDLNSVRILGQVAPARLQEILKLLKAQKPVPPEASAPEKAAAELGVKVLERYLNGEIGSEGFLTELVMALAGL
jgi:hypothetical protein